MPHRGEIYFADLDPVRGSEQGGVRPVLILQNNTGNRYSPTVIAAAVTSCGKKPALPTHVQLEGVRGLRAGSIVLLEQLRTLDKSRLLRRVGRISQRKQEEVDAALWRSIGPGKTGTRS